jgi:hypothetical protein
VTQARVVVVCGPSGSGRSRLCGWLEHAYGVPTVLLLRRGAPLIRVEPEVVTQGMRRVTVAGGRPFGPLG